MTIKIELKKVEAEHREIQPGTNEYIIRGAFAKFITTGQQEIFEKEGLPPNQWVHVRFSLCLKV